MYFINDSFISISGSVSLATSSSANAEIQRQRQELLDTLTVFKIPQLYSKMIAANVTEDVLWDLSDKMLDDCELNDVEKLRYIRAKKTGNGILII